VATVVQCMELLLQENSTIRTADQEQVEQKDSLSNCFSVIIQSLGATKNLEVSSKLLKEIIEPLLCSFLRRCLILKNAVENTEMEEEIPTDFNILREALQLPDLSSLFNDMPVALQSLLQNWCHQYVQAKNLGFSIPKLGPIIPTELIQLPETFQELILRFVGVKCKYCNTVPKQGAVCLICGQLCCVASSCCYVNEIGECARHSVLCGGGLFIVLKGTYVLIIREERRTAWRSLYLDEHGEEDIGIKRGKPLYLSKLRYEELNNMWLSSSFDYDSKILAATVRDAVRM